VAAAVEFSRLADRHLDTAYRLASVVLGDPTEAEDAAHDAAVLAWRRFLRRLRPAPRDGAGHRFGVSLCRR
jgi:DNA-directed RNA polymerase specialized sigma24 family protein